MPRHAWNRVLPVAIGACLLAACTAAPADKGVPTQVVTKPSTSKPKGGELIPNGGSNLIPNGGSNLIPNGGSNLIPNGGSNLVPNGGASIVGNGGASFSGKHAALGAQLRDLAAIAHTRAAAGIIANNASGVVSNNNAGILASNGAGLIANNTAGVIAGNTGSLVPNGGASYALLQAAPAFQVTAQAGEAAPQEAAVPDGTTAIVFDHQNGDRRIVVVNKDRQPLEQQVLSKVVRNASDVITASHTERDLVYGSSQAKRGQLIYDETYDDAGAILGLTHAPSELVEPKSGLDVKIDALAFTVTPPAGSFAIRFLHLKAKETGTFTQVQRNVGGKLVGVDLADPLATLGGTSRFETDDGKLLFERTSTIAADGMTLKLTLQGGYAFELKRASRSAPWAGTVTKDGQRLGTATLTNKADASVEYAIAFDGEPAPYIQRIPE